MKKTGFQAELPYERFLKHGAGSLTNAELLAIVLRTGTNRESATDLGRKILQIRDEHSTALSVLHDLTMEDLIEIDGIGEVKAVKILCLAELSKRMVSEKAGERQQFTKAPVVADCYMEKLRHEPHEKAYLLFLDNKLSLIAEEILSIGTVNRTLLDPREIYLRALRKKAVSILLLHNHPSGDPTPSADDIAVTKRVAKAGEIIGIPLIDHIVIGDGRYCSMKESGHLTNGG
ncbi:MAG: DNA repair protein RadC [Lachnospiraceae bacterium]|nr:DNA repair protein RadC [Lachnospiraceae bacterium]